MNNNFITKIKNSLKFNFKDLNQRINMSYFTSRHSERISKITTKLSGMNVSFDPFSLPPQFGAENEGSKRLEQTEYRLKILEEKMDQLE